MNATLRKLPTKMLDKPQIIINWPRIIGRNLENKTGLFDCPRRVVVLTIQTAVKDFPNPARHNPCQNPLCILAAEAPRTTGYKNRPMS